MPPLPDLRLIGSDENAIARAPGVIPALGVASVRMWLAGESVQYLKPATLWTGAIHLIMSCRARLSKASFRE